MRKSVGRSNTQHYQRTSPCCSALHNCVSPKGYGNGDGHHPTLYALHKSISSSSPRYGHKIGDMGRVRTHNLWGVSRTRYRLRHTTPRLDIQDRSLNELNSTANRAPTTADRLPNTSQPPTSHPVHIRMF
ncbi:hypothetical protein Bbelb_160710 [Branchiostoma belcheri]|nr:hypothetical protein Bbelb_160710 [Branchiostoma belcheri]